MEQQPEDPQATYEKDIDRRKKRVSWPARDQPAVSRRERQHDEEHAGVDPLHALGAEADHHLVAHGTNDEIRAEQAEEIDEGPCQRLQFAALHVQHSQDAAGTVRYRHDRWSDVHSTTGGPASRVRRSCNSGGSGQCKAAQAVLSSSASATSMRWSCITAPVIAATRSDLAAGFRRSS